jgi:hypothetical protein
MPMLTKKLLQKRGGIGTDSSCGVANHANIPLCCGSRKDSKGYPKDGFQIENALTQKKH